MSFHTVSETAKPSPTTIQRRVTLSRTEQDCYYLEIELPDGVTVEQVDAELIDRGEFGKYAHDRSCYAWDTGTMACGAIVKNIVESRDDCPELDCGPIVRDDTNGELVSGSAEWPGHFRQGLHLEVHHDALITLRGPKELDNVEFLLRNQASRLADVLRHELDLMGNPDEMGWADVETLVLRVVRNFLIGALSAEHWREELVDKSSEATSAAKDLFECAFFTALDKQRLAAETEVE